MRRPTLGRAFRLESKCSFSSASLPSRSLGRTGLRTTILGLGGVGLGEIYGDVSEAEAVDCVIRALELGVTLIDTSPNYGNGKSEERIGHALNSMAKHARNGVTIVTKCGDNGPQNGGHSPFSKLGVFASFQESLKRIRPPNGKVDVLLLHDPSQADLDEFFSPGMGGVEAFRELRSDGSVTATGIGVREHDVLLRFIRHPSDLGDVMLAVNDWNLLRRYAEPTLFKAAMDVGAAVFNGGPLYLGLLSGIDPALSFQQGAVKSSLKLPDLVGLAERVKLWCDEQGIDLRALALHFAAGPGAPSPPMSSALVGARFASEVEELVESLMLGCVEQVDRYAVAAADFESVFGAEIHSFDPASHFYYDKTKIDL